jgi:hypothetical protein
MWFVITFEENGAIMKKMLSGWGLLSLSDYRDRCVLCIQEFQYASKGTDIQ